jgi:hypothetical protein
MQFCFSSTRVATSLRESNGVSKVIILPCQGMNQSQDVDNPITGRNPITQETHDFSLEVHVLADTLVPIVSTNTWWFGG